MESARRDIGLAGSAAGQCAPPPGPESGEARAFVRQARALVADLFVPRAAIYWTDMLVTVAIAYASSLYFLTSYRWGWPEAAALLVGGFALFRVGSFIHEIQHFPGGTMTSFTVAWNILCGIPMMTPSFLYDNHQTHHRHDSYGTRGDGEYLPLGRGAWGHFAIYLIEAILTPALVGFRFLVLVPLSFFNGRLRRWMLERFSFFGINPHYRAPYPPGGNKLCWKLMDLACSLRVWAAVALVLLGLAPWTHLAKLYALGVLGLGLNFVRNLTAHRYRNEGGRMSYLEQLLDSINITGHPLLTELWFPVGLRYHALHHLFPAIPYHNLGIAHRRLMSHLPSDSPYRRTVYQSYFLALRDLVAGAQAGRGRPSASAIAAT
jgi:fatty acid desaturase